MSKAAAVRASAAAGEANPLAPVLAVDVSGLWVRLGRRNVLRDATLRVAPGERVALVGPNGAGKSTLLATLATLIRPERGELALAGHDARRDGQGVRAAIGFLGHTPHLYRHLTARENLGFFADLYGVPDIRARTALALETVGLAAEADRPIGEFSRGMLQRLALAAATLHRPAVLLLDEPDAGLDQRALEQLPDILDRLCPQAAIIFSTHDATVARRLASRVVTISHGTLSAPAAGPAKPGARLDSRRAGRGFFAAVWAMLRKDLRVEWRAREQVPTLLVFAVLVALVFDMALVAPAANETPAVAAGVLWSSLLLAGTLAGVRLFGVEHDRGTLIGLRLAPVDPSALFVSKFTLVAAQMLLVALVQLAALSLLLNVQLFLPQVLATALLATLALAAVISLQSALVVHSRARELLMPLLALPLAVPVLLASVGATLDALQGAPVGGQLPWLGLLGVSAAVFFSLAVVLYPFAAES